MTSIFAVYLCQQLLQFYTQQESKVGPLSYYFSLFKVTEVFCILSAAYMV